MIPSVLMREIMAGKQYAVWKADLPCVRGAGGVRAEPHQGTRAGLMAARARGRVGGRKRVMSNRDVSVAKTLLREGSLTVEESCRSDWGVCGNALQVPARRAGRCAGRIAKIRRLIMLKRHEGSLRHLLEGSLPQQVEISNHPVGCHEPALL
jgi:hypothetical protein